MSGIKVEDLELSLLVLAAAASVRANDWQDAPDDLVAGGSRNLAKEVLGDGERRNAARDAGDVDLHGSGQSLQRLRLLIPLGESLGCRLEWRRAARLQGNQIGSRCARKAQLELDTVVDRIERAQRQKIQVPAVRIE